MPTHKSRPFIEPNSTACTAQCSPRKAEENKIQSLLMANMAQNGKIRQNQLGSTCSCFPYPGSIAQNRGKASGCCLTLAVQEGAPERIPSYLTDKSWGSATKASTLSNTSGDWLESCCYTNSARSSYAQPALLCHSRLLQTLPCLRSTTKLHCISAPNGRLPSGWEEKQ